MKNLNLSKSSNGYLQIIIVVLLLYAETQCVIASKVLATEYASLFLKNLALKSRRNEALSNSEKQSQAYKLQAPHLANRETDAL